MLVYLDTNIVIYLVERASPFAALAAARMSSLRADGARFVVSDLVLMEATVRPLREDDGQTLSDYESFFSAPELAWADMVRPVFRRAAHIRAKQRLRSEDSLHLAAAMEAGCEVFLTNDARLAGFDGLRMEVLG